MPEILSSKEFNIVQLKRSPGNNPFSKYYILIKNELFFKKVYASFS